MNNKILPLLAALLFSFPAFGQQQPAVRQQGAVTTGHVVLWQGNNLIKDGGGSAGTGTVTSVGITGDGVLYSSTFSGSPITTSGVFNFLTNLLPHTANTVLASPDSASGVPSFRALVAGDLPVASASANGAVHVPSNEGINLSAGAISLSAPTTSVLGGVLAQSGATSNSWVTYIDTSGVQHLLQPNFTNIAGTAAIGQGGTGLTTLGPAYACLQVNAAGTALQYNAACTGSPVTDINIGTSAAANNPAVTSDASTGLNSTATSTVSIAAAGSDIMTIGTTGVTLVQPIISGAWNGSVITPTYGGLGANESAATGVVQFSSGTASVSTALANGTTATTQSAGDNSTKIATTAFVNGAMRTIKTQVFSASGTFTPDAGTVYAKIECWGGGGGGGAAINNSGFSSGGGGGQAGGYSWVTASAATIGASLTVTIGTAGAAGSASAGGAGGQTSVGTLCVAPGGAGGGYGSGNNVGGAGGMNTTPGTGTLASVGMTGGTGVAYGTCIGGFGGSSLVGAGGGGTHAQSGATAGIAGTGFASGGSGAASQGSTGGNGGAGTAGYVIITEYIE